MTREQIIAEALRLYAHNGVLEIPNDPTILEPPTCDGQVSIPGYWVQAWVHVTDQKTCRHLTIWNGRCQDCGAMVKVTAEQGEKTNG